ncbi:MAG: potassium-transporting ATPase subunit KdpC [Chthoniobacterales bacterium]
MKTTLQSLRLFLVLTVLTGIIYPLIITGVAQLAFPRQANGSQLQRNGAAIGSELLAQNFVSPRYFWPRPSAADFATIPSGASNKGPTSAELVEAIKTRRHKFGADAPGDLLTASGSGLDPHVTPAAAVFQAERVAGSRGVPRAEIDKLIAQSIEQPQFGFLGEPRVNVLRLNLSLDEIH